mgnify:CR=1 FL=1
MGYTFNLQTIYDQWLAWGGLSVYIWWAGWGRAWVIINDDIIREKTTPTSISSGSLLGLFLLILRVVPPFCIESSTQNHPPKIHRDLVPGLLLICIYTGFGCLLFLYVALLVKPTLKFYPLRPQRTIPVFHFSLLNVKYLLFIFCS